MTDRHAAHPEDSTERPPSGNRFAPHMRMILQALSVSRERSALFWLGAGLVVVIGATAFGQIRLNAWNQPFYDALARKDLPGVGHQLLVFSGIAGALLILNVAQVWGSQMTKLKLREGLTRDLFAQWLTPTRSFLLAHAGEIGVNPDQRIHADAQHLAELSTDLGVGLLQATLLLVSFIGVLWTLSANVAFELAGRHIVVPGYMVWSALLYASVASLASWRVGRPLVELGAERYARESDLRFALVHVNEHNEGIAVSRGEAVEENRLRREFGNLLVVLRRLVRATTNLTWVTAGYGWFTIVAPIIVAAPAYFAGNLSFGGLLMAVGAFTQVQQSLRWFVDNAGTIADWRATLLRVGSFREALFAIDNIGEETGRIERVTLKEDKILIENLCISLPTGRIRLSEAGVEIAPREHVLIVGAPSSGKTSLFRAMAGIWPWGSGRICMPPTDRILFMSKHPYLPDGPLRHILAYPVSPDRFMDEEFVAVLTRMGLSELSRDLDRVARWDRDLPEQEQQGLAVARLLLHKPRWVVVDVAIESLDPDARETFFKCFEEELAATTLIYISGPQAEERFFARVLYLTLDPNGQKLANPSAESDARPKTERNVSTISN